MRLSPTTGKILSGQGGGTIAIDGVVPPSLATAVGGGWGWLDDDTCGGQADLGAGYLLRKLIVSSDTLSVLDATSSGVTDAATQFRAGNNFWAAFLTGGALKGVRSNIRATLPLAALGDIDETGQMVVVQNYTADSGLVSYSTSGSQLWVNSTTVLDGSNRLRSKNGSVAYQDTTSNWHLRDTGTGTLQSFAPRTGEVVAAMVPVLISGAIWVVELTNTQLTIRPATSSNGYVLSTSANLFNPDAVSMSAGTVRVGWSVSTGELPTDMRLADLTVTTGSTTLGSTTTGSLVFGSASAGTTGNFTIGAVEGGSLAATKQPRQAAKPDGSGFQGSGGIRQYQAWWDTIAGQAVAPPNLSQATGVLDPAHGGTGTDTGLTVIDGGNILPGTIPAVAMGWYWSPLTDGDVPQTELIYALGDTIMVAQMRTP
jgi:hypothetical protein